MLRLAYLFIFNSTICAKIKNSVTAVQEVIYTDISIEIREMTCLDRRPSNKCILKDSPDVISSSFPSEEELVTRHDEI